MLHVAGYSDWNRDLTVPLEYCDPAESVCVSGVWRMSGVWQDVS